jgi:hypothetical protein
MDRSVPVTENEDVMRWMMVNDSVLFQQTALAVGEEALEILVTYFTGRSQWVEAAKARWAIFYIGSQSLAMMDDVMELLEKCGPTRTSGALQLEFDVIGSYKYQLQFTMGSAARAELGARIAELGQNPLVRTDPWKLLIGGGIYPKAVVMQGLVPAVLWEGGKRVDGDSVFKGVSLWYNQGTPLMQIACDKAVGARKVILVLSCVSYSTRDTDTPHMPCFEGVLHATQASVHTHKLYDLRICQ